MTDPREAFDQLNIVNAVLKRAIPESWGADEAWCAIAVAWIGHMASTHGAHCPGRHCEATADAPAYVGAIQRAYRAATPERLRSIRRAGYIEALTDLAHELGVDLDG